MHIGSAHEKVEQFMQPEFCLPRSRSGNFLKVNRTKRTENENLAKDGNSEVGSWKKKFECHICHSRQVSRSKLYVHFALTHFREEIKAEVGENTRECRHCGSTFTTLNNLLGHIGSAHNKVEKYLPEIYRLAKSKRGNFFDLSTPEDTDKTEETDEDVDEEQDDSSIPREVQSAGTYLQCHICQVTKSNWSLLYSHYAYCHFKDQIKDTIENKNC